MKRVLIVNKDGLLSALPTEAEFRRLEFMADDRFLIGWVVVADAVAAAIQQEAGRVKVLMPELPGPVDGESWLYVAVVDGVLIHL